MDSAVFADASGGIDCISPTNRLKRGESHEEACRAASPSQPDMYECSSGAKLCCTETERSRWDLGEGYGTCNRVTPTDDGQCAADGEEVEGPDMYPDGQNQDPSAFELDDLCCSGSCLEESCMSGTSLDEDGKSLYFGSCTCTCGPSTDTSMS